MKLGPGNGHGRPGCLVRDQSFGNQHSVQTHTGPEGAYDPGGQPDVKGQAQLSFWTDAASGQRDVLLVIPKDEYAKMAKGLVYSIESDNAVAGY
jgi:hypothetical protein